MPWGEMTLVMDRDDGRSDEIEVPIYRLGGVQAGRAVEDAMAFPVELRRAFEQAGFSIRRDVRWTPLDLEDGQRVFVPLGELEFTPVNNRSY